MALKSQCGPPAPDPAGISLPDHPRLNPGLTIRWILAFSFWCEFSGVSAVWWDDFPRVVSCSAAAVADAQLYSASAAMNAVANDPGWGLWFTYGNDNGQGASNTRAAFQAAGIVSLSYNEAFGTPYAPIVELKWNSSLQRWNTAHQFWSWQNYSGGDIVWAGAWCWFDSFTNDLPANQTENSYFARPYTRMHPTFGGGAMTYPDGTLGTGFLNNDVNATNPINSRVYDAGGAKDIYGNLVLAYGFNANASASNQPHAGEIWVPATGQYAGFQRIASDIACPCWTNFTYAFTRSSAQLTGLQGSWTDNFGPWDSFMAGGPVSVAFGEWSVALFRSYLTNHFTTNQLAGCGVLATNASLASITNFDARSYFLTVASNRFGLASANLSDVAWKQSGWLTQAVWSAYKVFRRQNGSAALTNYDQNVHAAALQGGQTNFALLVNDILPSSFGWARGNFDLASTELSLGWDLTSGSRGFGLPPFGRIGPVCKAIREHGRSRFATLWLYNDGYTTALTNRGPVEALFYEMLASHALPKISVGDSRFAGTPAIQTNFLNFVARSAAPAFGARVPVDELGIYLSTSSILSAALPGDAANFSGQDHQYALWGWGTALSELHYQYRVLPEWKLTASLLQTLKVLIIPNASSFEPADVGTLKAWVTNGGCLIVTGDSGSRLGETGNLETTNNVVLAPLTGVTNYSTAPATKTNLLGKGTVYFVQSNLGRSYFDADAAGRAAQRPAMASILSNAFSWLGQQPLLTSSNAPTTVGLTLYQNVGAAKTFLDLNNVNVNSSTYVTTPTPVVDVDLARPAWLSNGLTVSASIVSPDGNLSVLALDVGGRIHLRLPSVTNYLSVILQPTAGMGAWAVDASGNWSNSNNWTGYIIPAGIASTAIFSNNITGDRVVTNDATRTVGNLVFGDADPSSPGGWTLAGASPLTLQVSSGAPVVNVSALGAGKSAVIACPLTGIQGLTKAGIGTLILSGSNSLGPVQVTAPASTGQGTLLVNGTLAGLGAVTVQTNAALGGTGAIMGPVTVQAGGTLSPGTGLGTLGVSNTLTLVAGSTTLAEVNAQTLAHDLVQGITTVTYSGNLVVSNLAGTLAAGQSFKLFSATSAIGIFTSITPSLVGNLAWHFNPTNGTLCVVGPPPPQFTQFSMTGNGNFAMSGMGPNGQGYRIFAATNIVLPFSNWTAIVTGVFGGGFFQFTDLESSNRLARFYRVATP